MSADEACAALGLPPLEDLEPDELRYLRVICRRLSQLDPGRLERGAAFDADELGIDPEEEE